MHGNMAFVTHVEERVNGEKTMLAWGAQCQNRSMLLGMMDALKCLSQGRIRGV